MTSELLPFYLACTLPCRPHEITWSQAPLLPSSPISVRKNLLPEKKDLDEKPPALGITGRVCVAGSCRVPCVGRSGELSCDSHGQVQPALKLVWAAHRVPKFQPLRAAPHTPALTHLWKSCSCEGQERHREMPLGTCNWRHATGDIQLETSNWRHATGGMQLETCSWRHATGDMQLETCRGTGCWGHGWRYTLGRKHSMMEEIPSKDCYRGRPTPRKRHPWGTVVMGDPQWGQEHPRGTVAVGDTYQSEDTLQGEDTLRGPQP